MYVCIFVHFICMCNDKEIEAMNLRESKGRIYGKDWKEEREGENYVIIF